MNPESWKIFLATALGALLGSVIALEVHPTLWWVGVFAGSAVGYLSYEVRRIPAAAWKAWQSTNSYRTPAYFWSGMRGSVVLSILVGGWVCFIIVMICAFSMALIVMTSDASVTSRALKVAGTLSVSFGAFTTTLLFLITSSNAVSSKKMREWLSAFQWVDLIDFSPPLVAFLMSEVLADILRDWVKTKPLRRAAARTVAESQEAARVLKAFLWNLFVLIHSERRLICGVDAAIGTCIGFMSGSALLGALAGGLIGVLNYELVTHLWLIPQGFVNKDA